MLGLSRFNLRGSNMRLSTKVILMSVTFTALMIFSVGFLTIGIKGNADIVDMQYSFVAQQGEMITQQSTLLAEQQQTIIHLEKVSKARSDFSQFKFWLYDLSVSWLNESEDNANKYKERLDKLLKGLTDHEPKMVSELKPAIADFEYNMLETVDAYVDDNRVLGNSLLAAVRNKANYIDETLSKLQATYRQNMEESGQQVSDATTTISDMANKVEQSGNEIVDTISFLSKSSIILIAILVPLSALFAWYFRRTITRSIYSLRDQISHIEQSSDLTKKIDTNSEREINDIAFPRDYRKHERHDCRIDRIY